MSIQYTAPTNPFRPSRSNSFPWLFLAEQRDGGWCCRWRSRIGWPPSLREQRRTQVYCWRASRHLTRDEADAAVHRLMPALQDVLGGSWAAWCEVHEFLAERIPQILCLTCRHYMLADATCLVRATLVPLHFGCPQQVSLLTNAPNMI